MTTQERMRLRRLAVNYKTQDTLLIMEDNIFNRLLLSLDIREFLHDIREFEPLISENARDYQKRDIAQILSNKYALNRNRPGYGKTFESIEYCRIKDLKRILIICPKSVVEQWKAQFAKWWPDVAQYVAI